MNKDDRITSCLGVLVSFVVIVVVGMVMNGWALSTIWNWFIPPIFGLTSLTVFKAMGVATVLQLFTGTSKLSNSSKDTSGKSYVDTLIESLVTVILAPILTVGLSYIILQLAF